MNVFLSLDVGQMNRFYVCFVAIRIYYHVVYIILDE